MKRILGDAFKILPTLADKSFDLVLTDVPYDLNDKQKDFLHLQFKRLAKRCIIVFSPPENQWIFPDIHEYLFWIKPISTKNTSRHYSRFVEMIFIYPMEEAIWNAGRHWSQYTNVFTDLVDNAELHSFRKPPSLIERLIRNHTNVGDKILDPFAGSFVVADTAIRLSRDHLSIEIDKDLFAKYA